MKRIFIIFFALVNSEAFSAQPPSCQSLRGSECFAASNRCKYVCHMPPNNPENGSAQCVDIGDMQHEWGQHVSVSYQTSDFRLNRPLDELHGETCWDYWNANKNDLIVTIEMCEDKAGISGDGNFLNQANTLNPIVDLKSLHYDGYWDLCVKLKIDQSNPASPLPPLFSLFPIRLIQHEIGISIGDDEDDQYLINSGLILNSHSECDSNMRVGSGDFFSTPVWEEQNILKSFYGINWFNSSSFPTECKTILHFKETSKGERRDNSINIQIFNKANLIN